MIKGNKFVTTTLLVAVLAIYGTIVFRSLKSPHENNTYSDKIVYEISNSLSSYYRDSFKIDFYLKDPFGSEQTFTNNTKVLKTKSNLEQKRSELTKPVIIPKAWPKIKYYGFVKQVNKSSELTLVSINNKIIKMKTGQTAEGITLIKSLSDSAIFLFNGQTKAILK